MKPKLLILIFFQVTFTYTLFAQTHKCIPNEVRNRILGQVDSVKKELIKEGKLIINNRAVVNLNWPLQQALGYNYNSYYSVTNFVDHDDSSGIQDYNCGSRSYDGHNGTDISLWPFDHNMVQNNQVEIIAASSGTIMSKNDGEFDAHCSWDPNSVANYVILCHPDGSMTLYWHMKNGSVTTKNVGQTVVAGEVLGVVASSGYSTGPHLHFELIDNNNNVIDPYLGTCNTSNNNTWWNNQKPYEEPTINHIQTNSIPASFQDCPNLDLINEETNFNQGDQIRFYAYYHDMLSTIAQNYTIYRPDGTVWQTWTYYETAVPYFNKYSYGSGSYTLPSNAMLGVWTFEVNFNGQTVTSDFNVNSNLPNLYCENGGNLVVNGNLSVSSYEIGNNGAGSAGSSTLGYYLSTNTTIATSDFLARTDFVSSLNVNATSTENITITPSNINTMPPDGNYFLGMLIDYQDEVFESNENDNNTCVFASQQVTIGCTDANAHNYSSGANFDNNNCETCTDGIQNGDETGVDCGGSLCASCCPQNLTINDVPISNGIYIADSQLNSQGEVNPNSNVTFKAGINVLLQDGFKASNYFKATIEGCPQ